MVIKNGGLAKPPVTLNVEPLPDLSSTSAPKKVRIRHHSKLTLSYMVLSHSTITALGIAVQVFQVCDSDSAGVVKMNILHCSLGDLCSARRLNSCCSTGAAQPPMLDSRGCTWQRLMCESVKCGVLFFTFSQSNPGGKLAVIECSAHLRYLKTSPPPPPKTNKNNNKRGAPEMRNVLLLQVLLLFFLFSQLFAFIPYKIREFSSSGHQSSPTDEARRALAFVI